MRGDNTRLRIENEMFGRREKKYSEEEQANYLMSLLMDNDPLLSAVTIAMDPEGERFSVFAHRGLSGKFIKEMNASPVGVTEYPKDGETERVLIPHTEAMVHESVRKGGNAVTVYRD